MHTCTCVFYQLHDLFESLCYTPWTACLLYPPPGHSWAEPRPWLWLLPPWTVPASWDREQTPYRCHGMKTTSPTRGHSPELLHQRPVHLGLRPAHQGVCCPPAGGGEARHLHLARWRWGRWWRWRWRGRWRWRTHCLQTALDWSRVDSLTIFLYLLKMKCPPLQICVRVSAVQCCGLS